MSSKSDRSFMTLKKKDCYHVAKEISSNAEGLFNDAETLASNGSYGRAVSFLILSMEEDVKALVLFLDSFGFEFRSRVKGIDSLFKNHKMRYPVMVFVSVINIFVEDLRVVGDYVKRYFDGESDLLPKDSSVWSEKLAKYIPDRADRMIHLLKWYQEVGNLRLKGFYVDVDKQIISPQEIDQDIYIDVLSKVTVFQKQFQELLIGFNPNELDEKRMAGLKKFQSNMIRLEYYQIVGDNLNLLANTKDGISVWIDNIESFKKTVSENYKRSLEK